MNKETLTTLTPGGINQEGLFCVVNLNFHNLKSIMSLQQVLLSDVKIIFRNIKNAAAEVNI